MYCLIDRTIAYLSAKGEKARAIKEYIKRKYHITIDVDSIKHRLKNMQESSSYSSWQGVGKDEGNPDVNHNKMCLR